MCKLKLNLIEILLKFAVRSRATYLTWIPRNNMKKGLKLISKWFEMHYFDGFKMQSYAFYVNGAMAPRNRVLLLTL